MNNALLKSCPFCGDEAHTKYWMSRARWYVTCGSCNARTTHYLDRNDAIKAWNKRAITDELQDYKDAIQAICDKFATIDECNECPVQEYGVCPQSELTDEQKTHMQADFEAEMQRLQPELYQT